MNHGRVRYEKDIFPPDILSLLFSGLHTGFAQEPVHLVVDANSAGAVISPLLFGHNLEHTRRAIWQGISAEMIDNRKFAATDCGLPIGWTTLTGRGVSIDDKVGLCRQPFSAFGKQRRYILRYLATA